MMTSTYAIVLIAQIIGLIYANENGHFAVTVTANPSTVSTQGHDIVFTCEYTGFTPPNDLGYLEWYFMNRQVYIYNSTGDQEIIDPKYKNRLNRIEVSNKRMIFTLSKTVLCDAGRYTCRVYSKGPGRGESALTVTKEKTPMVLEIHHSGIGNDLCVSCKAEVEKRIIALRKGESSNIRCVGVNPPSPEPKLKWLTVPEYEGATSLYEYADEDRCIYGKVNELVIKLNRSKTDEMNFTCVAEFTDGRRMETPVITIRESQDDDLVPNDTSAAHSEPGIPYIIVGTIGGGLFLGLILGILFRVVRSKNESLKEAEKYDNQQTLLSQWEQRRT